MEEIWKDIPGYEGLYQVSNLGNVKILSKYIKHYAGGMKKMKEKLFSPAYNKKGTGYYQCNLTKNGKLKCYFVHQLVMLAFVGPNDNKYDIDHINKISTDNRLCNLEYVTHKENVVRGFGFDRKKYSSNYVGVSFDKKNKLWHAYSANNSNKRKHIGYFKCETKAYLERYKYEKTL